MKQREIQSFTPIYLRIKKVEEDDGDSYAYWYEVALCDTEFY